jgi:photosystem II stability/assembly factor-like uncharacterized protein
MAMFAQSLVRCVRVLLPVTVLFVTTRTMSGATWTQINNGLAISGAGAAALAFDPASPSTIYSWNDKGAIFKSMDGAGSWTTRSSVSEVHSLVIDPTDSSRLFALTRNGVVKSANGGATWAAANTGLPAGYIASLAIDPFTPSTLYAGTYKGLFKSTNEGESWRVVNSGLPSLSLVVLTFDPLIPFTMYGVGANGGIFKSVDGAETWTTVKAPAVNVGFGDTALSLAIDPGNPMTLYAGSFATTTVVAGLGFVGTGNIARTTDGGQSWSQLNTGLPPEAFVRSLSIDPAAPATIYGSYVVDGGWGMIKTTDRGQTWREINAGLPAGHFNGSRILIDPQAPSTLFAGYVDITTGVGGVVKSVDSGETWAVTNEGRTMIDITVLAVDPGQPATVYAAAGTDGLFKSADNGANWTKLVDPWPGQYIPLLVIDSLHTNTLYAFAERTNGCWNFDDNLFKSIDGGSSWNAVGPRGDGCDFYPPSYVAIDPIDPFTLYMGGGGDSFDAASVKTSDGGASWRYFSPPTNLRPNTLVIDRTNPSTLYEASMAGVFKSLDGGLTWTETALSASVSTLALDPTNSNVLYATAQRSLPGTSDFIGLFKTTDGGATWGVVNNGLSELIETNSPTTAFVIDSANPRILYLGTLGYGVFKSTDSGASWNQFNNGLSNFDIRVLTLSPGTPSTLYAGTRNGVFAVPVPADSSDDDGQLAR